MSAVIAILRLPAVFALLLALLVCSGCGQVTSRHVAPDNASIASQDSVAQPADVIAQPLVANSAEEQPTSRPQAQPLLFDDERPEPYQPRGPPGLLVLPFFPAPLLLPADVVMPGELGVVVERVVRGKVVVAWAAISPVGWRVGWLAGPHAVGFRYYNPVTGRYISRDPAGYPNGLNNYLYVNNNPINRIDPHGLFWGFVLDIVAVASDTYQVATGQISGGEYAGRMAVTAISVGANVLSAGTGGLAVRAAVTAIKAADKAIEISNRAQASVDAVTAVSEGNLTDAAMALADAKGGRSRDSKGRYKKSDISPEGKRHDRGTEYPHGNDKKTRKEVIDSKRDEDGRIRDKDGMVIDEKDVTIEHKKDVVEHWNEEGHNQDSKKRKEWYNDKDNLDVKSKSQNSSDGAKLEDTYRQDTGPDYKQ